MTVAAVPPAESNRRQANLCGCWFDGRRISREYLQSFTIHLRFHLRAARTTSHARVRTGTHTQSQSWLTPFHIRKCFRFFNFLHISVMMDMLRRWGAEALRQTHVCVRCACNHTEDGKIKCKSIWKIKCENIEFALPFLCVCVSIYLSPCALYARWLLFISFI